MSESSLFTASQIGAALGQMRQAVQRALKPIPAQGKKLVRGNLADAWAVRSLPASMQEQLKSKARSQQYKNVEDLLSADLPPLYEPCIPVSKLSPDTITKARKLQEALARPLQRLGEGLAGPALTRFGLSEYKRVFGFDIQERHWTRLLDRTIERDRGHEKFNRIELYIDERSGPVELPPMPSKKENLSEMEDHFLLTLRSFKDVLKPTIEEKALLWDRGFEAARDLEEQGMEAKKARKLASNALWKCGSQLAKNFDTFKRLWLDKEKMWRRAQGKITPLIDSRSKKSGNYRAPVFTQEDKDEIIARAVRYRGNISQAWREILAERCLSEDVQTYYEGLEPAQKSYVPKTVRDMVAPEVKMLHDNHHGQRRANLNGAFISRTWNDCFAGDWYQADDVTLNNYYYAPSENGGFTLMRGQVLLMIDLRSTRILSFAMLDERNYNSRTIKTLITRTCDEHGMPRRGFYFEKGIWKNSRLITGKQSDDDLWNEQEVGLRDLFEFRHANYAKGKPVERVIGELQKILEGQPGDAGRNEMKEPFERLQERKRLVESGKVPAEKYFFNALQWEEIIAEKCREYNASRNDGKMTRGLTPDQAWQQFQDTPLVQLSGNVRYLLSHHKMPRKVGANGLTIKIGKQVYVYRNAETGRLRGQEVLAWFNPEEPDFLAVTDLKRENCFTVERAEEISAMDATEEQLNAAQASVQAHNNYARNRYRTLESKIQIRPRPLYVDQSTLTLGREMQAQRTELLDKKTRKEKSHAEARKVFSKLDVRIDPDEEVTDDRTDSAKELTKFLKNNL